jgi:hypothetical protein
MKFARPPKGRIIVTGMAVYLPLPGVIYQILHYLIGLRRLGYDAYYVEDSTRWVYDSSVEDVVPDPAANVGIVASVLNSYGFADRWAYRDEWGPANCYGMDRDRITSLYRDADALLNVTGQELREEQLICRRRIYLETDPFATQVRVHQGDLAEIARLEAHDTLFTFGENLGAADCGIPLTQFTWLPTRQPVDVELWSTADASVSPGSSYTTVTSWVNHVESVVHEGETYYWQKDREFERFVELPRRTSTQFELASSGREYVPPTWEANGWRHVPVGEVAGDTASYRGYIRRSRAEFTVARDQYTRPRTGWFSDRSACYLAAARPVITQDTGFGKFLPTGNGLFAFNNMEDILSAIDAIESDYEAHSRAAREIAVEHFAAEKVVASLMERAGLA